MSDNMSEKMTRFEIPQSLYIRLEKHQKDAGFSSVDAYVSSVLEEHVAHMENPKNTEPDDDEKMVMDRLKKLGYIT
jgi:hypothetical protein